MTFRQVLGYVLCVSALSAPARATMISFEGDAFPEDLGFVRDGTMDADRWLENGELVQSMDLGVWGPPPYGESDYYRHDLSAFVGAPYFFAEWRLQTDGPSTEFTGSAPAVMSFYSFAPTNYHITMANDQVRFLRDVGLPILYFDVTPDVPHTYSLELFDDDLYRFSIDGLVMDEGIPEGSLLMPDAGFIFGGRYYGHENTNRWDFVRVSIPEPASATIMLAAGFLLLLVRNRDHLPRYS